MIAVQNLLMNMFKKLEDQEEKDKNQMQFYSRFTNEKMKEYLQNKECRRDFLLKHYGFDRIETDGDCCDNCSNKKK